MAQKKKIKLKSSKTIVLAIDVGNTNLHWAFIKNGKLTGKYNRIKHNQIHSLPWQRIESNNTPVVAMGALRHIQSKIKSISKTYKINFISLNASKQNIIKNTYKTLGIDRICNLIGGLHSFSSLKSPLVVIDFGSATTISACDKYGNFLGGILRAGIETEFNAISSKPLSLPHVEIKHLKQIKKLNPFSKTSYDAILNGVLIGQIGYINYFLNLFQKQHKNLKAVLTGGNAPLIAKLYKDYDLYDPSLTLKGIYYWYRLIHTSCKHN